MCDVPQEKRVALVMEYCPLPDLWEMCHVPADPTLPPFKSRCRANSHLITQQSSYYCRYLTILYLAGPIEWQQSLCQSLHDRHATQKWIWAETVCEVRLLRAEYWRHSRNPWSAPCSFSSSMRSDFTRRLSCSCCRSFSLAPFFRHSLLSFSNENFLVPLLWSM